MPVIIMNAWKTAIVISGDIHTLGSTNADIGNAIVVDSSGNYYICGHTYRTGITGDVDGFIAKYDSSGVLQWQRELGISVTFTVTYGIAVDSSDNPYVTGQFRPTAGGNNAAFIAKYNPSGTLQWQKKYVSDNDNRSTHIRIDSSDNIYLTGFSRDATNTYFNIPLVKTNSAGVITWSRLFGGTDIIYAFGSDTDSSGNIYISGYHNINDTTVAVKYNSSGVLQWQRELGVAISKFHHVEVYDSNNIYFVGETDNAGAGDSDALIVKYNSSGVIQSQQVLGGLNFDSFRSVKVDSVGNVYAAGYTTSEGSPGNMFVAKYNSSGVLQWQRVLISTAGTDNGLDMTIDAAGDYIYLTGHTTSAGQGGNDAMIVKLPTDGSGLGSYGGGIFTYAESTLTATTTTITESASTYTDAAFSLTELTGTFVDQASALVDVPYSPD